MADSFLDVLQSSLNTEVQQQQQTDWGNILANALAQGAKGAAAGFAEAKPNDYGSQLASALVGGLATGYGQGRERDIRNNVLSGLADSVDATKAGEYESLATALTANNLDNLSNAITADNYNFDLGLNRVQQQEEVKNQLALALEKGKLPIQKDLEAFKTDQNIRQQDAQFNRFNRIYGNNKAVGSESQVNENEPNDIQSRINKRTLELQSLGVPGGAAAAQARQEFKGELEAMNKTFASSVEASQKAQELRAMAQQGKSLMQTAGDTGGYRGIGSGIQRMIVPRERALAMDAMDTFKAAQFATARVAGTGAVSDKETQMYLSAGFQSANEPETNQMIVQRLENIANILEDKAEFDSYMRQSGNFQKAQDLWNEYMRRNPLLAIDEKGGAVVDENGLFKENNQRQSWKEFLGQVTNQPRQGASQATNTVSEGTTATHPTTGQKIIFKNGKWENM